MLKLFSSIGPVEDIRRGQIVRAQYDPNWDEMVLTVTSSRGRVKALHSWSELVRETSPKAVRDYLVSIGASVVWGACDMIVQ